MKRLLGPAPSELPWDELLALIHKERSRVAEALLQFKMSHPKAKAKKKGAKKKKPSIVQQNQKVLAFLDQMGKSIEDLL